MKRPDANKQDPGKPGVADRASMKTALRERDEASLTSGAKSATELRRENAHFAGLNVRLDFSRVRSLS